MKIRIKINELNKFQQSGGRYEVGFVSLNAHRTTKGFTEFKDVSMSDCYALAASGITFSVERRYAEYFTSDIELF